MANTKPKFIFFVGIILLLHAAYSAAQHRSYLRLTEQEFTSLPLDIVLQAVLSFLVTMFGVTFIAGDFKEIRANVELQKKTWDSMANRPSFYTFHHRGNAFAPSRQVPSGKAALETSATS